MNLGDSLSGFLKDLGIASATAQDNIEEVVENFLKKQELSAHVVGTRWNILTIEGDHSSIYLLRYAQDQLLATLEEKLPGQVAGFKFKVKV